MTLYERIGGEAAVAEMLDAFYARVLNDSDLRPFFAETSVEHLKKMQREFFAAALDGPVTSTDRDIATVHQGRGIQRSHVTRFAHHLIETLKERESVDSGDAMQIIFRIATYSDHVIDAPGGEDG